LAVLQLSKFATKRPIPFIYYPVCVRITEYNK